MKLENLDLDKMINLHSAGEKISIWIYSILFLYIFFLLYFFVSFRKKSLRLRPIKAIFVRSSFGLTYFYISLSEFFDFELVLGILNWRLQRVDYLADLVVTVLHLFSILSGI